MDNGTGQRTIEYCTDEISGEINLLHKVLPMWDLWSVRIIGPGHFQRARHYSDA